MMLRPDPGVYADISNEDYHAADAETCSGIKAALVTPAHYRAYRARELQETPAMRLGSLVHTAILEPEKYDPAIWDGGRKGTKAHKEWMAENIGREHVTADEAEAICRMRDSVYRHPMAFAALNAPGMAEASAYAYDPITGLRIACRPDYWREDGILVDLKTAVDASPNGFAKACGNLGYHIQAAHYIDTCKAAMSQSGAGGIEPTHMVFVVVEKEPPYAVGCYALNPEDVDLGRRQAAAGLRIISDCKISRRWPAYGDEIQTISLPHWARKEVA